MTPPNGQQFAYRRNPTRSIHASTFQPQQFGHSHGYTVIPSQLPSEHSTYALSNPASTATADAPPPSPTSSGFNLASITKYANIDELKGLVNRFGGLDGILSTVTTVQKVMSTVGQIAPLVKTFTGLRKSSDSDTSSTETTSTPARRRSKTANRSKRNTTSKKKKSTPSSHTRKPTKKSAPLTKQTMNSR